MARLMISPDAVIRVVGGKVWCGAGRRGESIAPHDPDVLPWLARFATPTEESQVIATVLPDGRERARREIASLTDAGILISQGADEHESPGPDADPTREAERASVCLAALAGAVNRLAGDLAGFGPDGLNRFHAGPGPPLGARLASALVGILSIQVQLRTWRDEYVAEQLRRIGIGPDTKDLKLNIGAGRRPIESWVNVDVHPADLAIDLRWGLGLPDGCARWVVMSHVLEHLYFPGEARQVLGDVRRVLAPGGVARIVVPDAEKCLRAYVDADTQFFDNRRNTWTRFEARTRLEGFLNYVGAGPGPGHFLSSHKYGYDFETLEHLLRESGFTTVERSEYMGSRHEPLRVDDVSRFARATFGGQHYSLFVEASA